MLHGKRGQSKAPHCLLSKNTPLQVSTSYQGKAIRSSASRPWGTPREGFAPSRAGNFHPTQGRGAAGDGSREPRGRRGWVSLAQCSWLEGGPVTRAAGRRCPCHSNSRYKCSTLSRCTSRGGGWACAISSGSKIRSNEHTPTPLLRGQVGDQVFAGVLKPASHYLDLFCSNGQRFGVVI